MKGGTSLSEKLPGKAQVVTPSQGPTPPFILPPIEGLGQDYTFIQKKVEQAVQNKISYHKGVSVVIPVYNRKAILEKTLAALTHQTYPGDLIEIIIADDGSSDGVEDVIEKFKTLFDISHVKQRDEGYRLSAIRNKGIKQAKYDYIIILDCDMLPAPEVMEEFMKWFHITDNVVLIGHRRFVNADEVTSDQIMKDIDRALSLPDIAPDNDAVNPNGSSNPIEDWRISIYEKTDFLKKETLPFRAFAGGFVGIPKKHIEAAGYFDESFVNWGGEDGEFAFRLCQKGLYFVPLMTAVGLHQEHPFPGSRKKHKEETKKLMEQKMPVNLYRKYKKGILYEVPKVSIYIPAYNAGKYIRQAVDSALRQTYTDLEICICDDGSTDNTVELLEKSYSDHPRVHWLTIPHGGIGKTSNTAVKMCRGLYIGQLDADDMLLPHAVETCVKYLDTHPDIGCVYGTYERIDESGKFIEPGYNWPEFSREKLLNNMIVHPFRMFRKRDWSRTTGFDETYENAVDYDMYVKLSEVCKFHHINEVLYRYRINKQGTSMTKTRIQTENTHKVVKKILKKHGLDQSYEISPDPLNLRNVNFRKKVNKSDSELSFWRSRLKIDNGKFGNSHYRRLMLAMAEESSDNFIKGKIIADFGCGPRGSLVWAKKALLRIGIDVLADRYSEEFTQNIISHGMIYLKSTEKVIPLPSDYVDVMVTLNAMDHVDSFSDMCNEIIRVLKPGGEFIGSFNLEEPASPCEPQQLNEQIIKQNLLDKLEIQSYRITKKGPKENLYLPFFNGNLSYEPGQEGFLWVKAKKIS